MHEIVVEPKILIFDIECSTITSRHFRVGEQYMRAENIVDDRFLISIAWKWLGEKKVHSVSVTPKEAKNRNDKRIVKEFAQIARKADYFIYHNGDKFDNRELNSRLLFHDLEPIGEVKSFDTLKLARKYFNEHSNKLDELCGRHLGTRKLDTDFQLWVDCEAGDKKALKRMVKYNEHDVKITEQWFNKLRPFAHIREKITHKTVVDANKVQLALDSHECNQCGNVGSVSIHTKYKTVAGNMKFYVKCKCCYAHQALKGTYRG